MMIIDLLKYFARFPRKAGVLSMFANGGSDFPRYAELSGFVRNLPEAVIPEIENFVFGQSFDHVKQCIDRITGSYLFVDYGEFSSGRTARNSIIDSQKLAATVAIKLTDSADIVETAIASDTALSLLADLRKRLILDSRSEELPWLDKMSDSHEIIPFVSPEFKSIGWTLMFSASASDWFDVG
ncbi:hypothetical protein [Bacteroides zoogleoformans]|nr:hypothetical protein [Bacteroides zoogleoformans]